MRSTLRWGWPLIVAAALATPVAAQTPSCDSIRDAIRAQTGLPEKPDTDLLRTLALRKECRFTAAEVYRAAYGDKPMPTRQTHQRGKHHDDDD